ncbi:TPA: diguanylate cyclase, partial [Enterobacter hormaechei subsp. xiangfangensis]|nr:diguanylate cyclase [Enterobacter hormaechei subsp. xiangfangensis]
VGEIDNFLSTLNTAIKEHYLWSEKFLCLNLFGGEPDYDIIHSNSHLYCHFSEWLMLRTQGYTLERDMVLAINHHHQGMHDIARSLAEAVISGTATRSLVSQYHEQQQAFIDSIETYKSYLFAYRNQHDTLTGLPLRQLLYQEFPGFLRRCQRNNSTPYLLIMDIDRFKSINDNLGHNAGDYVLQQVAQHLQSGSRDDDRLYRFGGEEFIILLEAKNCQAAQSVAERIRCHLADSSILVAGQPVNITVTGGLTEVREQEGLHEVIGRADNAMYYGKNNGRNCCVLSQADKNTYQKL